MDTTTGGRARSLAADLRARTDDEVAALLATRPDLLTPVPADLSALAVRSTTRTSVTRALDRLDRFHLRLAEALALLPVPTTLSDVTALVGATPDQVESGIESLHAMALVWGPSTALHVVRTVGEVLGPHPAGLGPRAANALAGLPPSRTAALSTDLGLVATGDPVRDAQAIAARLADPAWLAPTLDALGQGTTDLLRLLADGPPEGQVDRARRDVRTATATTPVEQALARGLVVPVDDSTVVIPREVALHLRGGVLAPDVAPHPPAPAAEPLAETVVDAAAAGAAFDVVRRVETLLEAWGTEPPPQLRTGGLGVRDTRRLPELLDTDERGAVLVVEVAHAAGLLAADGGAAPRWLPTPGYDAWRRRETAERWVVLVQAWLRSSRAPGLIGSRPGGDRALPALSGEIERPLAPEVRRTALVALAGAPAGTPATEDEVRTVVRWHRPRRGGTPRDDLVGWTLHEAATLGVTGRGALASWARPLLEQDAHTAAELLAPALPVPLDHVLLQADLTAVAPGPLRPDVARELDVVADVSSRGAATVYRFSPESIRRALDAGRAPAELHAFLAEVSRTPVPQPLSYLVDDVGRRHGLLRVGMASSFLRCTDPATVAAVLASPRRTALRVRQLADTVLVSDLEPAQLLDQLRRAGFTPTAEAADGSIAVRRDEPERTAAHRPPEPTLLERPAPDETLVHAGVRALRAGDRSVQHRPAQVSPTLERTGSAATLAELRTALELGLGVWIGYVDNQGTTTERIVDPVKLEGGWLTAFDHRTGRVRSFAVHRISGVAPTTAE